MLLKDFLPPPDVQEYVQLYRIVHLHFENGQEVPHKAYPPRPEHCLAFYPFDTETVKYLNSGKEIKDVPVVLYGQFTEVTNRMIGHNFLVLQVIFYPGALYRLTGIPATEITNQYLDATTVFSSSLKEINEQLFYAKDYAVMLNIVNQFIRSLINKSKKPKLLIDDASALLLKGDEKMSVDQMAKAACLSIRQLERKFKERTGINPKLYERIIRFDNAFRLKNSHPQYDWLRIAMACGYHDYQHLAKEYKTFTMLTPTAFHEIENKAPERKFGLIEGSY
ncbi:MAG: AraC family transcriptional regulator [Chitinophagaceae bacterium]|nr:AraC family transcriptional regulator [Chitinophagaceae bacterium]